MENVLTVGLQTRSPNGQAMPASLRELAQLVETAGGQVLESHLQKLSKPDPATFIGKGKAHQLCERAKALHVRTVVFDEELKPIQQRNLEKIIDAKVIDRTRLILDIFARRARTREGLLQVELAQLTYRLPRLTGHGIWLDSQTGGIGTRGPGERKLEVDRRRLRDRIAYLKAKIEKIREERRLQRSVRRSIPVPQVALVGYTNAGKSTLLNTLLRLCAGAPQGLQHQVYADDKLFATLDPTTRRIQLPSGRVILFSDTVGFIRKLPIELVAAFRATLEEVAAADLLVMVVDVSDPAWKEHEQTVVKILHQLQLNKLPRLAAYNKIDRLSDRQRRFFNDRHGVSVSAESGEGLSEFLTLVEDRLARQWVEKEFLLSYRDGARLAQCHELMEILSEEVTEDGILVRVRTHPATLAQWLSNPQRASE